MSTIVTRAGKGSSLTWTEMDANLTNLNTDKLEINPALGTPVSGTLTNCTGLPAAGVAGTALVSADIGIAVQAYNATLAALAAQTEAANKVQYYTADNTPGLLDFKDEDDMASDSATAVPSQQSVKAYVDAEVGSASVIVQIVEASPVVTVVTCSTAIPNDDTIPQNTEGDEVITVAITPTSATNRLRIEAEAICCISTTGYTTMALFQDSTAAALAVDTYYDPNQAPDKRTIVHEMEAGTTSATTFKIRVGPNTGTVYVNGQAAGTRIFGGISAARLRVVEIKT